MIEAWSFRENVNPQQVLDFLLCIAEICDAIGQLEDADESNTGIRQSSQRGACPFLSGNCSWTEMGI